MTANWRIMRNTLVWLLVAVMTLCIVIASPYIVKSDAASAKASTVTVAKANNGKWGAVKNGKIDTSVTGVYKNTYGWWYVKKGLVQFDYNGIQKNQYGWWRIEKGKVNFNATGVYQNEFGWWRVKDGKVDFNANEIYQNYYGWWKTTNGKVTFKETGVFKNTNGWWRVENSKVNFKFNGIATNQYGSWYIENGKVVFSANGIESFEGNQYWIRNGKAYLVTDRMRDAVDDAQEINDELPLSREIIIEILMEEDYNYSSLEAEFAADNSGINYDNNAYKSAREYLKNGISRQGLHEALLDLDQFTESEVSSAMTRIDSDYKDNSNFWNNQAVLTATNYLYNDDLSCVGISRAFLKECLEDEQFTASEVKYALDVVDADAAKDANFWNEQALAAANELVDYAKEEGLSYTKEDIKTDLIEVYLFTEAQAAYAISNVKM